MFLATQDKPFLAMDFYTKFKQAKHIGFTAFEIDGQILRDNHQEIFVSSQKTDLPIKMICGGYGGWIGDFNEEKRHQGLQDITQILEVGASIGVVGIVLPAAWGMFSLRLPPMVSPRSAEEDKKVLLNSLACLEKVCEDTKTKIFLEPINRYENHMILSVEEAVGYITAGDFKHVKVTADYFHMNIEEDVIEKTLDMHKQHIGHIHLASSQRLQPGLGHLDYLPGFSTLKQNGYQGGFTVECRVQAENEMSAYEKSTAFVRTQLEKAGFSV